MLSYYDFSEYMGTEKLFKYLNRKVLEDDKGDFRMGINEDR